jgi:hypothetical protein
MGPAGAVALVIGGLVTAMMAFSSYQEKQKNQGKEIAAQLTTQKDSASNLLNAYEKLNPQKAIDKETTEKLIKLYPELAGKITANVTSVKELKEAVKELDEERPLNLAKSFIAQAEKSLEEYNQLSEKFKKAQADAEKSGGVPTGREDIESGLVDKAKRERDEANRVYETAVKNANDLLGTIGKEVKWDDATGSFKIVENLKTQLENAEAVAAAASAEASKSLSQKLGEMPKSQAQVLAEMIAQTTAFLNQRADLEKAGGEGRAKTFQAELEEILNNDKLSQEEKIAAAEAAGEERVKVFQAELEKIKKNDKLTKEEKIAAEKATAEAILGVRKKVGEDLAKQQEKQKAEELERQKKADEERKNHIKTVLDSIGQTEAQGNANRQSLFSQFLSDRLEAERQNDEERISMEGLYGEARQEAEIAASEQRLAFLQTERETLLAKFQEGSEEYLAAQKAADLLLLKEDEKTKDARVALKEAELSAMGDLFGSLSDLLQAAGKDSRAAAIAAKALASAQAAINSYLAFSRALAEHTFPMSMVIAATVLASGLAQQIKILSTPIPSAETGGRFIVPNSTGVDSQLMRVNPGEEVDVTPRGMAGFEPTQNIVVQIDKQTIFNVVTEGIRSGDIVVSTDNY